MVKRWKIQYLADFVIRLNYIYGRNSRTDGAFIVVKSKDKKMKAYKILVHLIANGVAEANGIVSAEYFYKKVESKNDEVYTSLSKCMEDVHEVVRSFNYLKDEIKIHIDEKADFEFNVSVIVTESKWISVYESEEKYRANWNVLRAVVRDEKQLVDLKNSFGSEEVFVSS